MAGSGLVEQLVEALRCLPGVGPKSAQRMALHLLQRDREGGRRLSEAVARAVERVGNCQRCRALTEDAVCRVCRDPGRDARLLCVVETPTDQAAIERTTAYRGRYFVLMGHLSPLDGVGPDEIGAPLLEARLREGEVEEVILATGSTVEGQATAHYLSELAREAGVRVTRLAQGVPLGGELEFVDGGTLAHALSGRLDFG
ncbi:MAG: recombination protein RecR [Ectothiorhodospiraceae bacterium]|nr:recombination protein RecR [Chromatiales bacterium]MCP5157190.1 recombination protein RecR [Ectothiorhodospiraceae bacterium]